MNPSPEYKKQRIFYGYIVAGAAFIIQILTWRIYNSYGVSFSALEGEFGWSRATISGAASLSQLLVGIGAVFLGRLNDRFGPRILMVYVGVMVGAGYFMMSQTDAIWQLYVFQGFIVGIGGNPIVVTLGAAGIIFGLASWYRDTSVILMERPHPAEWLGTGQVLGVPNVTWAFLILAGIAA